MQNLAQRETPEHDGQSAGPFVDHTPWQRAQQN